jgi:CRISPR/Cas system endoribonuclease Cas6 (RAMP superfamily)
MRGILGLPPEAAPEEAVCVKVVEAATHMRWTEAGPKLGAVPGWVGTATVECNAVAAWLLLAAGAGIGLGSKRAYGFGRVEVRANKPRATRVPPD